MRTISIAFKKFFENGSHYFEGNIRITKTSEREILTTTMNHRKDTLGTMNILQFAIE